MRRLRVAALGVLAAGLFACSSNSTESKPAAAVAEPAKKPGGIDLAGMDRAVAPGDDFFQFANGTWFKTTEIPSDKSSYGIGGVLTDRALERTRALIDALATPDGARTADERRVADYVAAYMD